MKKALLFSAIFSLLAFSSCKKDKPELVANVAEHLQNKNWKLTALTVHPAYQGVTNVLEEMWEPCNLDDIYQFNANNQFILNSGMELCWSGEEQEKYGFWNYEESSRVLTFALSAGELYPIKITSISGTEFRGETYEVFEGENYTARWIFRN